MRLSREALAALCAQHSVPQETDKLIMRYCIGLRTNRTQASQILVHLKQYSLWLYSNKLRFEDTDLQLLTNYAELLTKCYFTPARKSMRFFNILKFLAWCEEHKFFSYDKTDMPLSKDDILSRPVFGAEVEDVPHEIYVHAMDHYVMGTRERGYAILRVNGASYGDLMKLPVKDLNLNSRLRITWPGKIVHTPEFQDREDVLLFLIHESHLKLTEQLPTHLRERAVIDKTGMTASVAAGRYENLVRLLGLYASTKDPRLAEFIELHFPANQAQQRFKNCKALNLSKEVMASAGRLTSSAITAMYRERLPW